LSAAATRMRQSPPQAHAAHCYRCKT
jgi:hypothetical protein